MKRPLFTLALVYFSALIAASFFNFRLLLILSGILLILIISMLIVFSAKPKKTLVAVVFVIFIATTCFSIFKGYAEFIVNKYADKKYNVEAIVISKEINANGRQNIVLKSTSINNEKLKLKIRLYPGQPIDIKTGSRIIGEMSLFSALESDSAAYTRSNLSDMIFLSAFIQDDSSVKIIENKTVYFYLDEIRNNIKSIINGYLDKDQGGIAIAMLIGDTSYLTEDVKDSFSTCGVTHVVSVSGMHLSIISLLVIYMLKKIKLSKKTTSIIAISVIFIFAAITLFCPTVIRAGVMSVIYFLGSIFGRRPDTKNSLGAAAVCILIVNPMACLDVGFQLSFLATLGIITIGKEMIIKTKKEKADKNSFQKLLAIIKDSLIITISAVIFTLPVIVLNFNNISLITPIANIFITLLSPLILYCAMLVAILGIIPFISFLAYPAAIILGLSVKALTFTTDWLSKIPFAKIMIDYLFVDVFIIFSFAMFCLIFFKLKKKKFIIAGIFACIAVLMSGMVTYHLKYDDALFIKMIKSDNGGFNLVLSKNNKHVIIDCGGNSACYKNTVNYIEKTNSAKVKALLIPFDEKANINGILYILDRCNIDNVLIDNSSQIYTQIESNSSSDYEFTDIVNTTLVWNDVTIKTDFQNNGEAVYILRGPVICAAFGTGYDSGDDIGFNNIDVVFANSKFMSSEYNFNINYAIISDLEKRNNLSDATQLYYDDNVGRIIILKNNDLYFSKQH